VTRVERHGSGGPWEDLVGYSRVVVAGSHAWTAGCTATVDGDVVHEGDPTGQARTAFGVALDALMRAGFGPADVVRTRMYIRHTEDADAVGSVHAEPFGAVRPVATMVAVAGFVDSRMLVEVELEAFRAEPPLPLR
jgi:enamine deaminase RidA (YjgF/YER057c/UK114 family)